MRFNWLKIKLILLLALISGLFYSTISVNNLREIKSSDIYMYDYDSLLISEDSIQSVISELLVLKNINKSNIHKNNLEFELNKNQLINQSDIFIDVSGNMIVNIKQRKPIARFLDNKNYLDVNGLIMPKSKDYSPVVPIIVGFNKSTLQLKSIYKLSHFIYEDKFLRKNITKIIIDSTGNFVLQLRKHKFKVSLGRLDKLELKVNNFKAFYIKGMKDQLLNKYSTINLQFDNQVVGVKK
jgi:cell division protein FtsQ|tara:strand:+ start:1999 stop:2715 length:717 start_codon:yes stop_codon:yes gene_type:complete